MTDGYGAFDYVMSGVMQGSVLGPLLFIRCTLEHFFILENKLSGHADDYTLLSVLPSQGAGVTVTESLNRDLGS